MRGLVAVYYVVLRAVLRNKPHLRRYIARCRYCWIFFVADPRNVGREDLGCPFGCADLHRRQRSKERSVRYNGSPVGKAKRHQRKEERRRAFSAPSTLVGLEGSPACCGDGRPVVTLEARHLADESGAGPLPRDLEVDQRSSAPEAMPPTADPAASIAPIPTAGPAPEAEKAEYAPAMVNYLGVVVSLIEERHVGRAEILEMLARTKRQHSFARERRVDYVLRRLGEEPEKPP